MLHFKQDAVSFPGDGAAGLATDFLTNMGTTLRARATPNMSFEYIEVVPLVPYGGGPQIASWPANTLGTSSGSTGTGTAVEVVTLYTAMIGRRHRGRIFLSGGSFTGMLLGAWDTAQTTKTQAFVTAMMNRYGPPNVAPIYVLGVWSRVIGGEEPPYNSDGFTEVTATTVRTLVRNQRRRQIGVGR